MANKLQEVPFKNDIGQTIVPGDKVITVTTGYAHRVAVRPGTYVGTVNGHPSIVVQDKVWGNWDADGNRVSWQKTNDPGVKSGYRSISRRTTLQRNRVYAVKD